MGSEVYISAEIGLCKAAASTNVGQHTGKKAGISAESLEKKSAWWKFYTNRELREDDIKERTRPHCLMEIFQHINMPQVILPLP